jgi:signal transduction histidine kinase
MTLAGAAKTATQPAVKPKNVLKVLQLEDSSEDAELVARELRVSGYDVVSHTAQDPRQFREQVRAFRPDIILADYNLGQWKGIEAVEILRQEGMDIPLILVTGALGDVTAVECIKQGATDYLLKDSLARLPIAVRRALKEQQLRRQRKEAEEELAHSVEELARSNQDLEQFAYVASHDLQEPLRMVAAYTELLAEKYKGRLDEQADKYIRYAVDGATRMQTLIQDLLAFSRAGRREMEMGETDCNTVVDLALLNLEAAVRDTGAQIVRGQLPTVPGNSAQLGQVFQNIVGNAIKFHGPEPPSIGIFADRIGDEWLFSVADNGIGVAPDRRADVFTAFTRLHTREEYPGNGIGLAICKKIIERHNGRIWVESGPGGGASFKFALPAQSNHGKNPRA